MEKDNIWVLTSFTEDDWTIENKAFTDYDEALKTEYEVVCGYCDDYGIEKPTFEDFLKIGVSIENEDIYRNADNDFVCVNADCRFGEERVYVKINDICFS